MACTTGRRQKCTGRVMGRGIRIRIGGTKRKGKENQCGAVSGKEKETDRKKNMTWLVIQNANAVAKGLADTKYCEQGE